MKFNFRILFCCLTTIGSVFSAKAEKMYDWAASGSFSVGSTKSFTIPAEGEKYLSLSGLKAGNEYTFVASGHGADVEVVYIYSEEGDIWDMGLASGSPDMKTDNQVRCFVTYDDWTSAWIVIEDPEDKEWKVTPKGYFLHLYGDEGAQISVSSYNGIVEEPIPIGDPDNPKTIVPTTLPQTYSGKYLDGMYYFEVSVTSGYKYLLSTAKGTIDAPAMIGIDPISTTAEYNIEDVSESAATEGNQAYLITATSSGVLSFYVSGYGESFGLSYQYAAEGTLGRVTVITKGVDAKWQLKGARDSYGNGETVAVLGSQTIVFSRVTGFTKPPDQIATPTEDMPEVVIVGEYSDTFDPKDDVVSGAAKISPSAKVAKASRTLFTGDARDHFAFTPKDFVYYNFELADLEGDAVMTIFQKNDTEETVLAGPATKISKYLKMEPTNGDYIIRVAHSNDTEIVDSQYALQFSSANVGMISLAKTSLSVKKSAGEVKLTVNRSGREGKVRVRYGTVADTAVPGVDYIAQNGELVWEDGDNKAKTITIRLIPEVFVEDPITRQFGVQIDPLNADEIEEDEYMAFVANGKNHAVITVTEPKSKVDTPVKAKTVKSEVVPLETGTYAGVLREDGFSLTNGLPALASVSFSAKNATMNALSAKVMVAGKTYQFKANNWSEESDATTAIAELSQIQKIANIPYTNTLRVAVLRGDTSAEGAYLNSAAKVELVMTIPDANNKGGQEDIVYAGEIFRDNSKIQEYLYAVTNVVGYYTVAMTPWNVAVEDGVPAGNGFITITIGNDGKAKVAGQLPDGSTKPTYTAPIAFAEDGSVYVQVYFVRSPACFGGVIRMFKNEDGIYVVDGASELIWNNDKAELSYYGDGGWQIVFALTGGYFDKLINLQRYYLTSALSVQTADIHEFPSEVLTTGYSFETSVYPSGIPVNILGDVFSTDKKVMVKEDGLYDLPLCINPCNVQVKVARATGIVSGSFSVWSVNGDTAAQKEVTGFKHNGVMIMNRDAASVLDDSVASAGYFFKSISVSDEIYNPSTDRTVIKKRTVPFSAVFNIMSEDQGDPDWWVDDWGEQPID